MYKLFLSNKSIFATALLLGLVSNVQADIATFDIDNPKGSTDAGKITNIWSDYNTDSSVLNWQSTISESDGKLADGFWLVLSDGANPKSHFNEYAILYGDSYTGNLSAYVYNGVNSSDSWKAGEFIQTFGGVFETDTSVAGEVTFNFSIDTQDINKFVPQSPGTNDWDGVQYGENIGVWYHPIVFNDAPTYNADDSSLSAFSYGAAGWYDTANKTTEVTTTDIPEPGTFALASLGLLGLIAGRRRKK